MLGLSPMRIFSLFFSLIYQSFFSFPPLLPSPPYSRVFVPLSTSVLDLLCSFFFLHCQSVLPPSLLTFGFFLSSVYSSPSRSCCGRSLVLIFFFLAPLSGFSHFIVFGFLFFVMHVYLLSVSLYSIFVLCRFLSTVSLLLSSHHLTDLSLCVPSSISYSTVIFPPLLVILPPFPSLGFDVFFSLRFHL